MAADGPVAALTRAALRDHAGTLNDDDDAETATTHVRPPPTAHLLRPNRLHPQMAASHVPSQVRSSAHRYYASRAGGAPSTLMPPRSHARWGVTPASIVGKTPSERVESMRTRWDLEWHRGMLELHRLGLSDALSMPDLVATPLGIETVELERAYGERADEALVHPWRPANFARYMQDVVGSFHLLGASSLEEGTNPITGVAPSDWRDRLAHLDSLLPRIRSLPVVAWNQAEFDAGQEKWRAARRWDEDTELDLGDDASMTSAQASAWMRFQSTCEETHLVDPRAVFEGLKESLERTRAAPRQFDGVASSVDAAMGPLVQAHQPPPHAVVEDVDEADEEEEALAEDGVGLYYNYDDPRQDDDNATPKPAPVLNGDDSAKVLYGSVSSLARSLDIPTRRSDVIDDIFGPHPDDHHMAMPPRPGDAAFLPPMPDGIVATDPRTSSRKVTTIAPPHRVVDSFTEVSAYLASATYVASLCGPPLRDMAYGVIIVPAGEEALLLGNWRSYAPDADDDDARALKHDVLEKSRAVREDDRRRERRMNREAREEARARAAAADEDERERERVEAERLAALKRRAIEERRPSTPNRSNRNSYAGPPLDFNAGGLPALTSPEAARPHTMMDRRARDRERNRIMAADRDTVTSKRSSMHMPEIHSPLKHSTTAADPPTPPRSIRKSTISVDDAGIATATAAKEAHTKASGNRLSGEPRPSLSLFPRRSDSEREGARSPLVLGPPVSLSPLPPQTASGAPSRRPSVLEHSNSIGHGHARRHSHGDRDRGDRERGEGGRDRGRKSNRDSDGVLFIRQDRSPRRRHLSRTGTVPINMSGAIGSGGSISSQSGGLRSRIKRLKGRMGLM
jgi:hypothetical protein